MLYVIFRVVNESIFKKILETRTIKETWVTLKKLYEGDGHVRQMKLQTLRDKSNLPTWMTLNKSQIILIEYQSL